MSNDIIQIASRQIGAASVQTVNARELHAFLAVKSEFRNWIKNRIDDFDFLEDRDFATVGKKIPGGGRQNDYFLTIDMAKELSMVERNAKGKEARQYFIECERRAKSAVGLLPQSFAEALRLAADLEEGKVRAEQERDHAIATKSQIGSRREATAMAAASAAVRESAKLRIQLGFNTQHATIVAVENTINRKFGWRPLKTWCNTHGAVSRDVLDRRYGTVKAWPAAAWREVYGVDLAEVFGTIGEAA